MKDGEIVDIEVIDLDELEKDEDEYIYNAEWTPDGINIKTGEYDPDHDAFFPSDVYLLGKTIREFEENFDKRNFKDDRTN